MFNKRLSTWNSTHSVLPHSAGILQGERGFQPKTKDGANNIFGYQEGEKVKRGESFRMLYFEGGTDFSLTQALTPVL